MLLLANTRFSFKEFFVGIFIFIASITNEVKAQPPILEAFFSNLTASDGLPSEKIYALAQDSSGFYWIGTAAGLVKYDGQKMYPIYKYGLENYKSLAETITSLYVDDVQQLWIGTFANGLWVLNLTTGSLQNIPNLTMDGKIISQKRILTILKLNSHQLLISTNEGFPFLINKKTKEQQYFSFNHPLNTTLTSKQILHINDCLPHHQLVDNYWITTNKGLLLYNLNDATFNLYPYNGPIGKAPPSVQEQTKRIYATNDNELWISSWGAGILHFDIKTQQWQEYIFNHYPPRDGSRNVIRDIVEKSSTELYIATHDYGPGVFNLVTKKFSFFDNNKSREGNPLPGLAVQILQDRNKNTWFANSQMGISIIYTHQQNFKKLGLPPPKHLPTNFSSVYSVLDVKAINPFTIVVGMREHNELFLYFPSLKKWQSIPFPAPFNNELLNVTNILEWKPNKYFIITLEHGFFELDITNFHLKPIPVKHPFPSDKGLGIYRGFQKGNKFYAGTRANGIVEIDLKTASITPILQEYNYLLAYRPFLVYIDSKDRLYAASFSGLVIKNPMGNDIVINGTEDSNKIFNSISGITEDKNGDIWFASTISGILQTTIDKNIQVKKHFNKANDYNIFQPVNIYADSLDNIWALTEASLIRINSQNYSVEYFGEKNGLVLNTELVRLFPVNDNEFYTGVGNELYRFNASDLQNEITDKLEISEYQIEQQPFHYFRNQTITLAPKEKYLSIFVSSMNNASVTFYYKINEKSNWVAARQNEIVLNNLNAGTYKIEVGISHNALPPTKTSKIIQVKVNPNFWETKIFRWGIVAVILLATYLLLQNRLTKIQKKNALQLKISNLETMALKSQMNPHFLFNTLNTLRYLIITKENDKASEYTQKLSMLLRMIMNHAAQEKISLTEELEALELYLDIERLRFDESFNYNIVIDKDADLFAVSIPPLIVQPFVENALKHGLANSTRKDKLLTVHIKPLNPDILQIIIIDNGIGIENAKKMKKEFTHNSEGNQITLQRIDVFNKLNRAQLKVEITNAFEEEDCPGTQVIITHSI